jgi:hypothetical protein
MSRLDYMPHRYVVVVAARPNMLHRADCMHLTIPNPGAQPSTVRPARLSEARTLPVCKSCEQLERKEEVQP